MMTLVELHERQRERRKELLNAKAGYPYQLIAFPIYLCFWSCPVAAAKLKVGQKTKYG